MKDLTVGREGRRILFFALPLLVGSVFQQLYNIVDSIIVGRVIGKEALAAVGNAFPLMFTLIALIIGVAFGGTIIISQYFGAKDIEKVKRAIGTIYLIMFSMALVLTVTGLLLVDHVLKLIDVPEEIFRDTKIYISIIFGGLIFFFGFNGTSAILRGLGDSKTPMYFMIVSTFFNIALDLLFVIQFKWGIAGAAFATVISQAGAFFTAVIYLNRYHKLISIGFKHFVFDREIFLQSLRIGLPTGFQQTFVALGMMALMKIVNQYGTNVIAGYSVAGRIDSIAVTPAMIFSQALAAFVGQNIGAGRNDRVKRGLKATFIMSSIVSIILTIFIFLAKYSLVGLFNKDPEVMEAGVKYLTIVSAFYLVFTAMFTLNGVLRGAGDTLVPMFISLIALWLIRIPGAVFLSENMGLGATGIWWAVPSGWFVGMVLSFFYYKTGRWKDKSVVKMGSQNISAVVTPEKVLSD